MERFQAIVLGGGPGGYTAAIRLGKLGVKTLIVDKGGLGGVCIREGCIPSKALLHHTLHQGDMGLEGLRKKASVATQKLMKGIEFLLKKAGVTYVSGWGSLQAGKRLVVETDTETLEFQWEKLVLATGSRVFDPFGLPKHPGIWDSTTAISLPEVPDSLVVAGGGYVGLELATIYARLGSEVTVIEMMDRVLPALAPDMVRIVAMGLKKQGIRLVTKAKIVGVQANDNGVSVTHEHRGRVTVLEADKFLNAVGRKPATQGFGLDTLGLSMTDRGFVFVDDTLRTSNPDVYAIGDLTGPPMLAHKAYAESRVAALNIAGIPTAFKARVIPSIVFTSPPAGMVGMIPKDKTTAISGTFPLTASGRAVAESENRGFVRVWADRNTHRILACETVGRATEVVIAEATLAIQAGLTLETIADTVHAHPTYSEVFAEACEAALGESLHIP